jgi:hypothetical protein
VTLFPAWIFGRKEAKAFKACYDSMNDMVNLPFNMVKKQVVSPLTHFSLSDIHQGIALGH